MKNPFARAASEPTEDRPSKVLTMTTAGRLAWEDRGPDAKWQYAAWMPSGNFYVVFSEFDQTPRMGFIPKGSTITTHEETVAPELAEDLYEAINRNIFGDKWHRQERLLDSEI